MSEIYLGKPSKAIEDWCKAKYPPAPTIQHFFTFTATGGYNDESWQWHDTGFIFPGIKSTKNQKLTVYVDDVKIDEYNLTANTVTSIVVPDVDYILHSFKFEFEDITALTYLDCSYTSILELDVTNCTALTDLDCNSTSISELDVTNCTALRYLNCYYTSISELDVTNCTALRYLNCYYTSISELDVTNCTALTHLNCNTTSISELDVTNCTALTALDCSYTSISELDVTNCTALTDLYCSYTSISELDVTNCTALTDLYCSYTSISELDLAGTAMTYVNISETPMASNPNQPTNVPAGCEVVRLY